MTSTTSDCFSGYKFSLLQPLPLHILFSSSYLFSWCHSHLFQNNPTSLISGCPAFEAFYGLYYRAMQNIYFVIYHGYFHILVQLICQLFLVMHFWFVIQEAMHWNIFFLLFLFCRIAFPTIDSIIILKNKAVLLWVFWREETIVIELHWSYNVQEEPKVPRDSEHQCISLAGCITRLCVNKAAVHSLKCHIPISN